MRSMVLPSSLTIAISFSKWSFRFAFLYPRALLTAIRIAALNALICRSVRAVRSRETRVLDYSDERVRWSPRRFLPCYRNLRTKYFEQMEVVMDTRVSVNTYPALFRSADTAANNKQKRYLALLRAEYATLLLASILSSNLFSDPSFFLLYAAIFLAAVTLLLLRTKLKPEQDWYRCRALAESVKTLTWRYMMRASPFVDEPYVRDPLNEFTHSLNQLINDNRSTLEKIATSSSADDQITDDMNRIRKLDLKHRKDLYDDQRIQEQRNWYANKASINRRSARIWVLIGVAAYTTAILLSLVRLEFQEWRIWPISPIITFASLVIGWTQIKKFNELAAAYTVAAQEIGLIRPKLVSVNQEDQFSRFVIDAELAFSREHTLWIARRT